MTAAAAGVGAPAAALLAVRCSAGDLHEVPASLHTIAFALLVAGAPPQTASVSDYNQVYPTCPPTRRQKTIARKTYCACYNFRRAVEGGRLRGSWCGDCLAIRMGEDINEVGLCVCCV